MSEVEQILRSNPKVEVGTLAVRFVGGIASLDIETFAYVQTADYNEYLRIQQDLLLPMMEAAEGIASSAQMTGQR